MCAAITRELQNPCNGPIDINSFFTPIRVGPHFHQSHWWDLLGLYLVCCVDRIGSLDWPMNRFSAKGILVIVL